MKTASEELHEYLVSLDDDALLDFCRKIDYRVEMPLIPMGPPPHQRSHRVPIADYLARRSKKLTSMRDEVIDNILQSKQNDPAKFEKTLRIAGIRADDARDLALSEQANRIARQAKTIAILALLASLLIPAGQWLVDSLGQNTQPPQTTSQPTSQP